MNKEFLKNLKGIKSEAKVNPIQALNYLVNLTNIYPDSGIDEAIVDSNVAPRLSLMLGIKHRLINNLNDHYYSYVIKDAKKLEILNNAKESYVSCDETGRIDKISCDDILEIIGNIKFDLTA